MWIIALLSVAAAEPTELEKERQKLIDMGIDPAVLDDLEASVEQTLAITDGLKELNSRLGMLDEALAKREDIAACQTAAVGRAGKDIAGELALSVRVEADGTVAEVREVKRSPAIDGELSTCVSTVVRGLTLPAEEAAQEVELKLVFPYAR